MRAMKLAEEEIIFSSELQVQNIRFLHQSIEDGQEPKKYEVEVDGDLITVIALEQTTVTSLMASFRGMVGFRLFLNIPEKVILISPSANKSVWEDELALEDYAVKIATNIFGNLDKMGNYGSKVSKSVKSFQLWNFYNYKLLLDL